MNAVDKLSRDSSRYGKHEFWRYAKADGWNATIPTQPTEWLNTALNRCFSVLFKMHGKQNRYTEQEEVSINISSVRFYQIYNELHARALEDDKLMIDESKRKVIRRKRVVRNIHARLTRGEEAYG